MHALKSGWRQQRLFTGALFPETINNQLAAFARRHGLRSSVWVPRKAIDTVLKLYNVYILPNAALCDVRLTPVGDLDSLIAYIGTDRVLVNAEQTSNPHLLEGFREFMVSCPPPSKKISTQTLNQSFTSRAAEDAPRDRFNRPLLSLQCKVQSSSTSEYSSASRVGNGEFVSTEVTGEVGGGLTAVLPPDVTWDRLEPFRYPLSLSGSPLLGTQTTARLLEIHREKHHWCNYWRRVQLAKGRQPQLVFAGDTAYAGRFNPHFCVHYRPHTYTNLTFPPATAALMRHRAVENRYVSRLWLTLKQAEELFGTRLLPEHANDGPVVYCNFFTGGAEATAFYCADQFDGGDTLFPNAGEIDIAAKGVLLSPGKLRAYPLLARLLAEHSNDEAIDCPDGGTVGIDQAMPGTGRHAELCVHRQRCADIRLYGFKSLDEEKMYLRNSRIGGALTRQCLLCDYPRPLFFSHRALLAFDLALRESEQGVVQTRLPVPLSGHLTWCNGDCWFNVSQLREPAVGQELMDNPPLNCFTRQPLSGAIAVNACRLQLARRCRPASSSSSSAAAVVGPTSPPSANLIGCDVSSEWIPANIVGMMGWKLREGALGLSHASPVASPVLLRFDGGIKFFFSMLDVCLDDAAKEWLRSYTPVNSEGLPFLYGLRQAMILRAFERGYSAQQWLLHRVCNDNEASKPFFSIRQTCKSVRESVSQLLQTDPVFVNAPFVRMGGLEFVNVEEVLTTPNSAALLESRNKQLHAPLLETTKELRSEAEADDSLSAESLHRHPGDSTGSEGASSDTAMFDLLSCAGEDDCEDANDAWASSDLSPLLYVE